METDGKQAIQMLADRVLVVAPLRDAELRPRHAAIRDRRAVEPVLDRDLVAADDLRGLGEVALGAVEIVARTSRMPT